MAKTKYYSLKNILNKGEKVGAKYYMVYGERSNGKTYACKSLGLFGYHDKDIDIPGYLDNGSQFAIVRRWQDDFKGKRGASLFDDLITDGSIAKATGGKWDNVYHYGGRWYLAKFDEKLNKLVHEPEPFAYAFAISTMEHDKSSSFPGIDKIFFDEFLTRGEYLPEEFTLFMNTLSTIIRDRNNVRVFLMGNSVNKYCPYFSEMGLTKVKDQKPGTIDQYDYGESKLHVMVEYADTSVKTGKASDVYFSFNNPRLKMITTGGWEMDIYPHAPLKWRPMDIKFTYFIIFGGDTLQAEIVQADGSLFTFIHRKTTPIQDTDKDLIFTTEYNPRPNYKRLLTRPDTELVRKLYSFFLSDKVFYQDNPVGEIMRNYLLWSSSEASS